MRKGCVDKWDNLTECKNLLFFAQTVDELIFSYSIPSHRLATLNSHYLCIDAIYTIADIEHNGVPEGSLRPIFEELYYTLDKDPVFSPDNSPLKYFVKEQKGKYVRGYNPNDFSYTDRRNIIYTIKKRVFSGNSYFEKLKEKIVAIVKANNEDEQSTLFALTKSLITELVNSGYDQRYIRDVLVHNFFNLRTQVTSCEQIDTFFDAFPCANRKYKVVLIADHHLQSILVNPENVKVVNRFFPKTRIPEESTYLQKKDTERYYIFDEQDEFDPYSAANSVESFVNVGLSLYILYDHGLDISLDGAKFIVYDENNYYTIIIPQKSAVHRMRTPKYNIVQKKIELTHQAISKSKNTGILLLLAANLHRLSLRSTSEENQILDLWAIVECILNISQEHTSDRITQVCSYLVPIIKYKYLYSIFEQLSIDIKSYDEDKYSEIIGDCEDDFQNVLSLAKYVLLDTSQDDCDLWLNSCDDFPLLKFRIRRYRTIFKTRGSLAEYIENHAQRVRWKIMRAYRNRNLIVHNGETMPYSALLVENLHSYVDTLLNYVITELSNGHTMNSMRQELFASECEWNANVEKKNAAKSIDADFIEYSFKQ